MEKKKKKNKTKASAPEQNNAENSPSENVKIPDEHQVFLNVTKAYEEAKQKRENYKKKGPLFVALSGIAFLALMFTLDSKIEFLILWVLTILFTVYLMVRAEYHYHKFQIMLGIIDEQKDDGEDEEQ